MSQLNDYPQRLKMFNSHLSPNLCFLHIEIAWYFNLSLTLKIDVKRFGFEGKSTSENVSFKKNPKIQAKF